MTILVAKLVTGEEVVCTAKQDGDDILYSDIFRLQQVMTPQGPSLALVPWMQSNPNVELNEETWCAIAIVDNEAPKSLQAVYTEMTSGIQIVSSGPSLELVKG